MAKNNPIHDIKMRKDMLRLQMKQQELEIERSARELAGAFAFPLMKSTLVGYVARNPETAFKVGMAAVNIFSGIFRRKKKTAPRRPAKKRSTTRKTGSR